MVNMRQPVVLPQSPECFFDRNRTSVAGILLFRDGGETGDGGGCNAACHICTRYQFKHSLTCSHIAHLQGLHQNRRPLRFGPLLKSSPLRSKRYRLSLSRRLALAPGKPYSLYFAINPPSISFALPPLSVVSAVRSICIALTSSCNSSTDSASLDPVRVSDGRVLYCWLMARDRFHRLLLHVALACENQLQLTPSPTTPAFSFSPNAHFQIIYAVLRSPQVLRFVPISTPPLSRVTFIMSHIITGPRLYLNLIFIRPFHF